MGYFSHVSSSPEIDSATLKVENSNLKEKVLILEQQLAWYKRNLFGSKSERFTQDSNQTELNLNIDSVAEAREKGLS